MAKTIKKAKTTIKVPEGTEAQNKKRIKILESYQALEYLLEDFISLCVESSIISILINPTVQELIKEFDYSRKITLTLEELRDFVGLLDYRQDEEDLLEEVCMDEVDSKSNIRVIIKAELEKDLFNIIDIDNLQKVTNKQINDYVQLKSHVLTLLLEVENFKDNVKKRISKDKNYLWLKLLLGL